MIGGTSDVSKPFMVSPEPGKKESKVGIISPEQMVTFVTASISQSKPQVDLLKSFHDNNPHLNAEQINYLIREVKDTINKTEHENHSVDAEILKYAVSNLINDEVNLAEIADKECVLQFLLTKENFAENVSNLKEIFFSDVQSATIFSKYASQISLKNEDVIQILRSIDKLPFGEDPNQKKSAAIDILAASNLEPEDKARHFQKYLGKAEYFKQEDAPLLAKFSSLKIDSALIDEMISTMAKKQPALLSQTIQYFGITDPSTIKRFYNLCCSKSYNQETITKNLANFTGKNVELAVELMGSSINPELINTLGFTDAQKRKILAFSQFDLYYKDSAVKKMRNIGFVQFDDPSEKIKLIKDWVNHAPEVACQAISSLATSIDPSERLEIVLLLVRVVQNQDLMALADSIRFLAFDEKELTRIANAFQEIGSEAGLIKVLRLKSPKDQIQFLSQYTPKKMNDFITNEEISSEAKHYLIEQLSEKVSLLFQQLNIKPPENLKEICNENFAMLRADQQVGALLDANVSPLDRAVLLMHFAPQVFCRNFQTYTAKISQEEKGAIISKLMDVEPSEVLKNLSTFDIKDKKLSDRIIKFALHEKSNLDPLHSLFGLYTEEERYGLALALQKSSKGTEFLSHLKALELSPKPRMNILQKEAENLSFFKDINHYDLPGKITSKELSQLIKNAVQTDGLEIFLKNTSSWNGTNVIALLEDSEKDEIVTFLAAKDWNECISNLSRFALNKDSIANLAKKAKELYEVDSGTKIVDLARQGKGAIIASIIKDLHLDENQRLEIAGIVAEQNISNLIPFLSDFNLSKNRLEDLAKQAVQQAVQQDDPLTFCQNIEVFQLDDHKKVFFLHEIAKNPHVTLTVAGHLSSLQIKNPRELAPQLMDLALLIYRRNPEAVKNMGHLVDANRLTDVETDRLLQLIKQGNLTELEVLKFGSNKDYLETIAHSMMKSDAKDINVIYWVCSFLEQAARLYQRERNFDKALELRFETSKLGLRVKGSPVQNFEDNLQKSITKSSETTSINYGITYNNMDSQILNGEHFRVRDVFVDNQEKRIIDFKVAHWRADEIRENLNNFDATQAEKLLGGKKISIKDENSVYYPYKNNKYDTTLNIKFEGGPIKVIAVEGLGTIQIGNDKNWGAESKQVKVILDKGGTLEDLQQMLSLLGLGSILLPSTEEDRTKFKINSLIDFFYPSFSAKGDHTASYHLQSQEQILTNLQFAEGIGAVERVRNHLKDLREVEVLPGETHLYLDKFSEEAEELGARAAMCGMGYKKTFKQAAEQLANILRLGLISTQPRYELGMIIEGASSKDDFIENSAGYTFFTLMTEGAVNQGKKIKQSYGNIQIFSDTEILNFLPYFHRADYYGANNRQGQHSHHFENRPGPIEFIRDNQQNWVDVNEMMFPKRVSPDHIKIVTYQDPRKILIEDIDKAITEGFDPNFFQGSQTEEEKIAFLTSHVSEVEKALVALDHKALVPYLEQKILYGYIDNIFEGLQTMEQKIQAVSSGINYIENQLGNQFGFPKKEYDPITRMYKTYSLDDHWMVDPKNMILEALNNQHVPTDELIIIEAKTLSEIKIHLDACNSVKTRSKKLQNQCRDIAGKFKSTDLGLNKNTYKKYLSDIKKFMENREQRAPFLGKEMEDKITALKKECDHHLLNHSFSGQDSLNRQLLTSEWNRALQDPDVILGLFAFAAQEQQIKKSEEDYQIPFLHYKTFEDGRVRNIAECIESGLDQHPIILEKLPLNVRPQEPNFFLNQYLKRTDIEKTFVPILNAIEKAYQKLHPDQPIIKQPGETKFDQGYAPEKWKDEYGDLASKIATAAEKIDEKELLFNQAGFSPDQLRGQVLNDGLKYLLKKEGIDSEQLSKNELIKAVSNSIYLLDFKVSHAFYDRLHLLAALTSKDVIETGEGPLTIKDLFMGIMKGFQEEDANPIAAEQFYLRLLMAEETISKLSSK